MQKTLNIQILDIAFLIFFLRAWYIIYFQNLTSISFCLFIDLHIVLISLELKSTIFFLLPLYRWRPLVDFLYISDKKKTKKTMGLWRCFTSLINLKSIASYVNNINTTVQVVI